MLEQDSPQSKSNIKKILGGLGILISLIAVIGVIAVSGTFTKVKVENLNITNLTSNSATVVWTTDLLAQAYVEVSSRADFKDKIVFYDDRDIEEVGAGEYELQKQIARQTHHITLRGLEPEEGYYYKIVNNRKAYDGDELKFSTVIATENLKTPDPVYGRINKKDGGLVEEGVVILQKISEEAVSQKISTVLQEGTYSIDASNLYNEKLDSEFVQADYTQELNVLGVDQGVSKTKVIVAPEADQPVEDITQGEDKVVEATTQIQTLAEEKYGNTSIDNNCCNVPTWNGRPSNGCQGDDWKKGYAACVEQGQCGCTLRKGMEEQESPIVKIQAEYTVDLAKCKCTFDDASKKDKYCKKVDIQYCEFGKTMQKHCNAYKGVENRIYAEEVQGNPLNCGTQQQNYDPPVATEQPPCSGNRFEQCRLNNQCIELKQNEYSEGNGSKNYPNSNCIDDQVVVKMFRHTDGNCGFNFVRCTKGVETGTGNNDQPVGSQTPAQPAPSVCNHNNADRGSNTVVNGKYDGSCWIKSLGKDDCRKGDKCGTTTQGQCKCGSGMINSGDICWDNAVKCEESKIDVCKFKDEDRGARKFTIWDGDGSCWIKRLGRSDCRKGDTCYKGRELDTSLAGETEVCRCGSGHIKYGEICNDKAVLCTEPTSILPSPKAEPQKPEDIYSQLSDPVRQKIESMITDPSLDIFGYPYPFNELEGYKTIFCEGDFWVRTRKDCSDGLERKIYLCVKDNILYYSRFYASFNYDRSWYCRPPGDLDRRRGPDLFYVCRQWGLDEGLQAKIENFSQDEFNKKCEIWLAPLSSAKAAVPVEYVYSQLSDPVRQKIESMITDPRLDIFGDPYPYDPNGEGNKTIFCKGDFWVSTTKDCSEGVERKTYLCVKDDILYFSNFNENFDYDSSWYCRLPGDEDRSKGPDLLYFCRQWRPGQVHPDIIITDFSQKEFDSKCKSSIAPTSSTSAVMLPEEELEDTLAESASSAPALPAVAQIGLIVDSIVSSEEAIEKGIAVMKYPSGSSSKYKMIYSKPISGAKQEGLGFVQIGYKGGDFNVNLYYVQGATKYLAISTGSNSLIIKNVLSDAELATYQGLNISSLVVGWDANIVSFDPPPADVTIYSEDSDVLVDVYAEDSSLLEPGKYAIGGTSTTTKEFTLTVPGKVVYFQDLNGDGIKQDNEPLYDGDVASLNIQFNKISEVQSYEMKNGWNLVSFPIMMRGEGTANIVKASDLLKKMNENNIVATQVVTYRSGKFLPFTYRKDNAGNEVKFGDDYSILPGEAYFIRSYSTGNFYVNGNKIQNAQEIGIENGWNLVSFYNSNKLSFKGFEILGQLGTAGVKADTLSKWEDGMYYTIVSQDTKQYGNDFSVYPYQGYFLRVTDRGAGKFKPV